MRKPIKRVKLFVNDSDKAINIKMIVENSLRKANFNIVDNNFDLAVAIGGDGSFLRMVKTNKFDSNIYYVGINAGTLGFLQEIKLEDIDEFIEDLTSDKFSIATIGVQETSVITSCNEDFFYSLNEIVIRDSNLKTSKLNILIDDKFLGHYVGDGVLIATSIGSTAYNLSLGGSVVFEDFHTLQLKSIAPLNNNAYKTLPNSIIIPENKVISVIPNENPENLLVTMDGENIYYNDVCRIDTVVGNKKIKCLRLPGNSYIEKIYDKFLKN